MSHMVGFMRHDFIRKIYVYEREQFIVNKTTVACQVNCYLLLINIFFGKIVNVQSSSPSRGCPLCWPESKIIHRS